VVIFLPLAVDFEGRVVHAHTWASLSMAALAFVRTRSPKLATFAATFAGPSRGLGYVAMHYGYVENMAERRQPFRKAHFEHWKPMVDRGELRLAGAYNPIDGALLIFYGLSKEQIEEGAKTDPYYTAGLVTRYSTVDWNVVIGSDMLTKPPQP
jgi:uncharacterized protein YciI